MPNRRLFMNQDNKLEAIKEAIEVIKYCLFEEFSIKSTSHNDQKKYKRVNDIFTLMTESYCKEILDMKPISVFTEDGFDTYIVYLSVIGIMNHVCICAPGNSVKDAEDCAIETMNMLKNNDMEIMQVIKVL